MPGVRRPVQKPSFQRRGEERVLRTVPVETPQAGKKIQGEQIPQAEDAPGGRGTR